jgi:DNA-binding NarL/FixJ family response regulator
MDLEPGQRLSEPGEALVLDLLSRDQLARAGFYVRDGFEAARQIREFAPDTKIIILSM